MKVKPSRAILAGLFAALLIANVGGCSWMGRTAGKAQAKVERNMQSIEKGYQEGYETERGKTKSKE